MGFYQLILTNYVPLFWVARSGEATSEEWRQYATASNIYFSFMRNLWEKTEGDNQMQEVAEIVHQDLMHFTKHKDSELRFVTHVYLTGIFEKFQTTYSHHLIFIIYKHGWQSASCCLKMAFSLILVHLYDFLVFYCIPFFHDANSISYTFKSSVA